MGKAIIVIGTNTKPGPTIECDDSLEKIYKILDEEWAKGHYMAVVETEHFKLIFEDRRNWRNYDGKLQDGGKLKLKPSQC